MPNDFTSFDDDAVEAVNSESVAQSATVWNGTGGDVSAGALVVTSSDSEENKRLVDYPSAKGGLVTEIVRYDYDGDDALEQPMSTYKLTPGLELLVPEENIATGTLNPGDAIVADTDGSFAAKAQATDYVVFQALTQGVSGGDGYFRVVVVGSQIA